MIPKYTAKDLAADLSKLMAKAVLVKADLPGWYEEAQHVQDRIRKGIDGLDALPHSVWHYLSDADIRLKDLAYAKTQNDEMLRVIKTLAS